MQTSTGESPTPVRGGATNIRGLQTERLAKRANLVSSSWLSPES